MSADNGKKDERNTKKSEYSLKEVQRKPNSNAVNEELLCMCTGRMMNVDTSVMRTRSCCNCYTQSAARSASSSKHEVYYTIMLY